MSWTDELKAEAIKLYKGLDPSPATTIECVKEVAEQLGEGVTANGVRAILTKAGVYIAAGKTASASKASEGDAKSTRVSKEAAVAELVSAINDTGTEPDMEIISKLTGKAAMYFASVLRTSQSTAE